MANVILVGNGSTLLSCAAILYRDRIPFLVLEPDMGVKSSIKYHLTKLGIPWEKLDYSQLMQKIFSIPRPLIVFSIGNIFIFPENIIKVPDVKIINYHNSYLPEGRRGRNCEAWSIYEEDLDSGVTWHYADSSVDTGQVICNQKILLDDKVTSIQLLAAQSRIATQLFSQVYKQVIDGNVDTEYSGKCSVGQLHYSKDIPNNGLLDLNWHGTKIWAFLRSMDYGYFQILGSPFLKLGNNTFSWQSYKKIGLLDNSKILNYSIHHGAMILHFKSGKIILSEFKAENSQHVKSYHEKNNKI